jgi:hypothetical protein
METTMSQSGTKLVSNGEIDLADLVRSANAGDKQSLAVLRRELAGGNAQSLIGMAADLAGNLEQATLNAMLGDEQQGVKLVLLKKLDQMRAELDWNTSPKLERILIERVCQTWLYLHWLETADTQGENRPIDLAQHQAAKIEQAEYRHLRAVKMLATVRKMALPLRIELKAEVQVSEKKSSVGKSGRFDRLSSVN